MHLQPNKIIERFPHHEIYLWSNYGFNPTKDIDLKFVGNVNEEIAMELLDLWNESGRIIDPTIYIDTTLFEHIPRFNRCTEDKYYFDEEIVRYKVWPQKNNEYHGREVEQISEHLYKVKQIFARKDGKYKNRQWTYPMLLSDYEKFTKY